jgi:hypothetical protein
MRLNAQLTVGSVVIWDNRAWVVVSRDQTRIGLVEEGGFGLLKRLCVLTGDALIDVEIVSKSTPMQHIIKRG